MNLKLVRIDFFPECCIGKLYIDGSYECHTLEDPVREIEGVDVVDWKIAGRTAIPYGTYNVVITMSNRFKRPLPLLENVPGFTGIRIHLGNTAENTEGCILVGKDRMLKTLLQSRMAFIDVFAKLREAEIRNEPITISIVRQPVG